MTELNQIPACSKPLLSDVFSLFLSKDKLRPVLQNPFKNNGKVVATDAYTLIYVNENDCDFEFTNEYEENAPNVDAVIPVINISEKINVLKSDFDAFKIYDEYKNVGEDIKCSECEGEGEVEWEYERWTKTFDCPKCDGEGLEYKSRSIPTGNKTFRVSRVKMKDTYFDMVKFYKLIQVQDVLGGDITLVNYENEKKGFLFKIGICYVLLMPCPLKNDDDCDGVLNIA